MGEYDRWQGRYAAPEYIFGEGPNAFLGAQGHLLPAKGRALAVADGEGRNGVWLAEQGLDVLSIDFAPNGQAKAAEGIVCRRTKGGHLRVKVVRQLGHRVKGAQHRTIVALRHRHGRKGNAAVAKPTGTP